jgi:hypothetical protein
MNREVILVEIVNSVDASTEKSKTFTKTEKAEKYFEELVRKWFPKIKQDELDNSIDDGFFDFKLSCRGGKEFKSVVIKEITFDED